MQKIFAGLWLSVATMCAGWIGILLFAVSVPQSEIGFAARASGIAFLGGTAALFALMTIGTVVMFRERRAAKESHLNGLS